MSDRLHLLIVDDDEDLTDILASRFQRLGLAVTTCRNIASCLEAVESIAVDAALIDGRLAGCDGLRLVAALRELQPDLPIVMFSGNVEETFIASAYEAGVASYLVKPCSLAELQAAIFGVLGTRIEIHKTPGQCTAGGATTV